jgi:Cu(I)/Ag(I) efflux system membrane fusion protein
MIVALLAAGVVGAGGYGLYQVGLHKGQAMAIPGPAGAAIPGDVGGKTTKTDPTTGRKVLYWHDPMVPGHKFDKPGKSPFMDMQLVPKYADDDAGGEGQVAISPRVQQNLGIRTAEVTRSTIAPLIEAVGNVAYNERDVFVVQARSSGFVERLYVRAPLDPVRKGQPLAELYVPDWIAAQEEYLAVRRMQGAGTEALVEAARQRMRLAGMTEDHIRRVESSGKVAGRLTLLAPASGVVTELAAREGMTVAIGAPLFRIAGLTTIWVNAEVPEALSSQVRPGNAVEARAPAWPGEVFKGKVSALLPEVDTTTRTLKARVELSNPGNRLVPGMFANINFTPTSQHEVFTVPTEAVIRTGRRAVVILAQENGQFKPVDVELGVEGDGRTEIRKGLEAGQKVIVSGQFLIDSEASLKGTITRMSASPQQSAGEGRNNDTGGGVVHEGTARIEAIKGNEITLSHGPIATLQWPAMTMAFRLPQTGVPAGLKVGDQVSFKFRETDNGRYLITSLIHANANANANANARQEGERK